MATSSIPGATPGEVLANGASAPVESLRRAVRATPPLLLRRIAALAEGLAYSSGLAALVGGAMTWAAGRALAAPDVPRSAALVGCGAFFIYTVDRLRDHVRDHPGSPGRTAFVLRHRPRLVAATAFAGLALIALLATSAVSSLALCLFVGAIGLLHRRLKRDARFKIAYVAAAWTAACVGLPWLARVGATPSARTLELTDPARTALGEAVAWSLLFVGAAVVANLIASNLRVGKASAIGRSSEAALLAARGLALAAVCVAGAAPSDVAPLAWIPAIQAVVLCGFRETERFGHLAVDGALLIGALFAIGQLGG